MRIEIALFGEDYAHRQVIGALVHRLARETDVKAHLDWKSAVQGHGRVVQALEDFIKDLNNQGGPYPHLVVVATDANCHGLNQRTREIQRTDIPVPVITAIPDPHIERWLLLDGAAFRSVFGRGCNAPDLKCDRDRYKELLIREILAASVTPTLDGIEFAEDIVQAMDIDRAMQADLSLNRFVSELRNAFRQFQL
ncbi:MAG: hypothetical protein F4X65_13300 [Chloroflexi bacterium]|nr:hypothetical protein [Chloroflexota bacterium]